MEFYNIFIQYGDISQVKLNLMKMGEVEDLDTFIIMMNLQQKKQRKN